MLTNHSALIWIQRRSPTEARQHWGGPQFYRYPGKSRQRSPVCGTRVLRLTRSAAKSCWCMLCCGCSSRFVASCGRNGLPICFWIRRFWCKHDLSKENDARSQQWCHTALAGHRRKPARTPRSPGRTPPEASKDATKPWQDDPPMPQRTAPKPSRTTPKATKDATSQTPAARRKPPGRKGSCKKQRRNLSGSPHTQATLNSFTNPWIMRIICKAFTMTEPFATSCLWQHD